MSIGAYFGLIFFCCALAYQGMDAMESRMKKVRKTSGEPLSLAKATGSLGVAARGELSSTRSGHTPNTSVRTPTHGANAFSGDASKASPDDDAQRKDFGQSASGSSSSGSGSSSDDSDEDVLEDVPVQPTIEPVKTGTKLEQAASGSVGDETLHVDKEVINETAPLAGGGPGDDIVASKVVFGRRRSSDRIRSQSKSGSTNLHAVSAIPSIRVHSTEQDDDSDHARAMLSGNASPKLAVVKAELTARNDGKARDFDTGADPTAEVQGPDSPRDKREFQKVRPVSPLATAKGDGSAAARRVDDKLSDVKTAAKIKRETEAKDQSRRPGTISRNFTVLEQTSKGASPQRKSGKLRDTSPTENQSKHSVRPSGSSDGSPPLKRAKVSPSSLQQPHSSRKPSPLKVGVIAIVSADPGALFLFIYPCRVYCSFRPQLSCCISWLAV